MEATHYISIHKALTGLDSALSGLVPGNIKFQSTRPSRASTSFQYHCRTYILFQSTRPSRASTRGCPSIRLSWKFQSTRPSRASTYSGQLAENVIRDFNPQGPHGPRPWEDNGPAVLEYFNPQGPHGPRHERIGIILNKTGFQSTRPSRASTN